MEGVNEGSRTGVWWTGVYWYSLSDRRVGLTEAGRQPACQAMLAPGFRVIVYLVPIAHGCKALETRVIIKQQVAAHAGV